MLEKQRSRAENTGSPMRLDDAYQLLDLDSGATDDAVRDAHRDLTKVWHPDRFGNDATMRNKAEEKLKRINEAYQTILEARGGGRHSRQESATDDSGQASSGWRVRTAAGEGTVPDLDSLVAHVLHGRVSANAEVFHPELGRWVPLQDVPELRRALVQGRARRRRGWAFACVALGALILLRRPSLGGLIIAAALIALAVFLILGTKENEE